MGLTPNVVANTPILSTWGNTIRDQTVMPFTNAAERASQWLAPPEGALSYLRDVDRVEFYNGTAWQSLGAAARSWTVIGDIQPADNGPISFLAIPSTYTHLRLIANVRANSGATTDSLFVRVNGDTGANYFDGDIHNYANVVGVGGGGRTGAFAAGPVSGAAGVRPSAHVVELQDYSNLTKQKMGTVQYFTAEGGQAFTGTGGWLWLSNAAISQLDLICAGNNTNAWKLGSRATLLAIR